MTSYAQPASYYPNSNVIAPPATATRAGSRGLSAGHRVAISGDARFSADHDNYTKRDNGSRDACALGLFENAVRDAESYFGFQIDRMAAEFFSRRIRNENHEPLILHRHLGYDRCSRDRCLSVTLICLSSNDAAKYETKRPQTAIRRRKVPQKNLAKRAGQRQYRLRVSTQFACRRSWPPLASAAGVNARKSFAKVAWMSTGKSLRRWARALTQIDSKFASTAKPAASEAALLCGQQAVRDSFHEQRPIRSPASSI